MGFSFRFESLLSYRAHQKEQAQIALAGARERLREANETLAALRAEQQKALESFARVRRGPVGADAIRNHADYLSALGRRIQAKEEEVRAGEQEVEKRLQDLLERTRAHSIMEKLKEKDYETWLSEQRRQERKILDETAILRHGRSPL